MPFQLKTQIAETLSELTFDELIILKDALEHAWNKIASIDGYRNSSDTVWQFMSATNMAFAKKELKTIKDYYNPQVKSDPKEEEEAEARQWTIET